MPDVPKHPCPLSGPFGYFQKVFQVVIFRLHGRYASNLLRSSKGGPLVIPDTKPLTRREAISFVSSAFSAGAGATLLSACSFGIVAGPVGTTQLTVTFLDVGKADAIILTTERSCVMIDTGTAGTADDVSLSLKNLGVSAIDALIVTHFDQDHVGGAATILRNFSVRAVYTTYLSKDSDEIDDYLAALKDIGLTAQQVSDETNLSIDEVTYAIHPPDSSSYDTDESNNSSLVTRVTLGDKNLLFTGDIEADRIEELVGDGADLSCDLLKVPHHGIYEKATKRLVSAASPSFAVITSSKDEKEDDETVRVLEDAGAEVYLTRTGVVTAVTDGSSLTVSQG